MKITDAANVQMSYGPAAQKKTAETQASAASKPPEKAPAEQPRAQQTETPRATAPTDSVVGTQISIIV